MMATLRRKAEVVRENGLWLTAVLTLVAFFGLFLVGNGAGVVRALLDLDLAAILAMFGLVTVSYCIRSLKWLYYLDELDVDVPLRSSLLTFFSGLMLVVTPAKAGEVWKAWFLRDLEGVPVSRTTAVVGAERVTDLLALSAYAAVGVVLYQRSVAVVAAVGGLFVVGFAVLQWRSLCLALLDRSRALPVVGQYAEHLEAFYEDSYAMFRARPLAVAMVISLLAWGLEGVALWVVLRGFGVEADLLVSLFVFGFGSVVGALSLLPGGLAAAEASILGLLVAFGYERSVSAAATLVIRVGTLWYGAVLGGVVFGLYTLRKRGET